MLLWLYRLVFIPALLVMAPYYLLRMRRRGGYRAHFAQRFGAGISLPPQRPGVRRVWLQAVSVGEMLAIGPLIEGLAADPAVEIYLTTTTSTGFQLARERYRARVAGIGYFPIDWWCFSARAWRAVAPQLVILTEGERWPEHIAQAQRHGVPVLCINARMSDRSYRRMQRMRAAVRPLLGGVTRVLAAAEHDAERFRELAFPAERIVVTGNIKLDVTISPLAPEARRALRAELGLGGEDGGDLILLGSSTWPGEEAALLEALRGVRAAGIACRLLLVPRHAERRGEIEVLLQESGLGYHFRSRGAAPATVDVAVGDTTGELRKFTQLADLVFVGKSLPPHHEGQTPVEAAALGKPILFGPAMSNFRVIARELVAAGAARTVADRTQLALAVRTLLAEPVARARMATSAQAWHRANQGALARTLSIIRGELAQLPLRNL